MTRREVEVSYLGCLALVVSACAAVVCVVATVYAVRWIVENVP